jgi:hypothetical protein
LIFTTGFRDRFGVFEHENEQISIANKTKPADNLKFILIFSMLIFKQASNIKQFKNQLTFKFIFG